MITNTGMTNLRELGRRWRDKKITPRMDNDDYAAACARKQCGHELMLVLDQAERAIAALAANPQAESALRDLNAVVIEQNRLGASWHPEVFGRLMNALANAKHVLESAPQAGSWIAAADVDRLVRRLDVALNGEAGAAPQAMLCDVVAQVESAAKAAGRTLLAATPQADRAKLSNPYTGDPRDYRDVESDPTGVLIREPGAPLRAATPQAAQPPCFPSGTRYTVERHGDGWAIYRGRDREHHGLNLGHLTECSAELAAMIEGGLNATLPAAQVPEGIHLGETIYTPPGYEVRFCYSRGQPNNLEASRLGEAHRRAAERPGGDYIDRGLSLLKELEVAGYGVFRFVKLSSDKEQDAQVPAVAARPLGEYHEDFGPVVWWRFPVDEPAWIGTPGDSDWPGYHTHWTPHPAEPAMLAAAQAQGVVRG